MSLLQCAPSCVCHFFFFPSLNQDPPGTGAESAAPSPAGAAKSKVLHIYKHSIAQRGYQNLYYVS